MTTNSPQGVLGTRWTLEGRIPLGQVAEGAAWYRARSVATGDAVALFVVEGETALETADAVRRAYLVQDDRLVPVLDVVVEGDPRDGAGAEGADDGSSGDPASPVPTTIVEYPLPASPPLAALLGKGPLHPETARSIIGEAATGLEVARRRGLRHQLLDSNRVFVDTAAGRVTVLGVGVEAASHPGLDRSREVASFQDTAALVSLLYRALTGRSPQRDAEGLVPRPSTVAAGAIPEDLDLLCELVLNESADELPETTRGLISALEPWQSIPVTLEAYTAGAQQAAAPPAVAPDPAAAVPTAVSPGTSSPAPAPEDPTEPARPADASRGADASRPTTPAEPVGRPQDRAPGDRAPGDEAPADPTLAVGSAAAVTVPGSSPTGGPSATPSAVADPEAPPAADAPAPPDPRTAEEARQLVQDLGLDRARGSSAFPGHLDIPVAPASEDAGGDAAPATVPDPQAPASGTPGDDAPRRPVPTGRPVVPAATAGTLWPAATAATATTPGEPLLPEEAAEPTEAGAGADAEPPIAAGPVHHGSGSTATGPVPVVGRTDAYASRTGPIVVRGRDHAEGVPETTVPSSRSALLREVVGVAVDADDPETFVLGPERPAERSRQTQWILLGGALLVIIAMVVALTSITSGLRQRVENPLNTSAEAPAATTEEPAEEEPSEEETTQEEPELPAASLAGVEVLTVDGEEPDHPEQIDRLTDGDPGTFWSTQIYRSPEWGGLMDGMGLRLELEEESTLSGVTLTTARNSGGTIELREVAEDGTLGEVLATGEFAGDGEVELELEEPVDASRVALWFPTLPADSNESGAYRGRVAEITVR